MKSNDALYASYYVISKVIKNIEAELDVIKKPLSKEIGDFMVYASKDDKVSISDVRYRPEGAFRVTFGGASSMAYYDGSGSIALFRLMPSRKAKEVSLEGKENLAAALGLDVKKVDHYEILDKLENTFPGITEESSLKVVENTSISLSRKKDAPTIDDAMLEIDHWLIKSKVSKAFEFMADNSIEGVNRYTGLKNLEKEITGLKDFVSNVIDQDDFHPNRFINKTRTLKFTYDDDLFSKYVAGMKGEMDGYVKKSEPKEDEDEKKSIVILWAGPLYMLDSGVLPKDLISLFDRNKASMAEKNTDKEHLFDHIDDEEQAPSRLSM